MTRAGTDATQFSPTHALDHQTGPGCQPLSAYVRGMLPLLLPEGRVRIEATAGEPGCVLICSNDGKPAIEIALAPLPRAELFGLANELCARGYLVHLVAAPAGSGKRGRSVEELLGELGFESPYRAYEATLEHARDESRYWDETPKPRQPWG